MKLLCFIFAIAALSTNSVSAAGQESQVTTLQRLLGSLGYAPGSADGAWGGRTQAALKKLVDDRDLRLVVPQAAPSETELAGIIQQIRAWRESDRASYDPGAIPQQFFWGTGSEWFRNIHNWSSEAQFDVSGQRKLLKVSRFGQLLSPDYERLNSAGVPVIRMHLHFEGVVFGADCFWGQQPGYDVENDCYEEQYRTAARNGWRDTTAALPKLASNPAIALYLDALRTTTRRGFHAIVTPNDFFWGNGVDWANTSHDPLLHAYLEHDQQLREFYVRWAGAVASLLREEGITNISFQALNEPRWCGDRGPNPESWRVLERDIFHAVRRASPNIELISSSVCTSADQYFSTANRDYAMDLGRVTPIRADLDGVIYSIHMRLPRLLFMGTDQYKLRTDTAIPYPFKRIPESAAADGRSRDEIRRYNKVAPDATFFAEVFGGISAFAKQNGVRMIVTEWGVPNSLYGLSPEARLALFRDFSAAAKDNEIAILYSDMFEKSSIAAAPHTEGMPDHRFDPAVMDIIAAANGTKYDHALDSLSQEQFDSVIVAARPPFDTSGVAAGDGIDSLACFFAIDREEDGEIVALALGRLSIDDGQIKFGSAHWKPGLDGDSGTFGRARMFLTSDSGLAGQLEIHFLFREKDGEPFASKSVTLDGGQTTPSETGVAAEGVTSFTLEENLRGIFTISKCKRTD